MSAKPLLRLSPASPSLFMGGLLWVASFWLPVFETENGSIDGYWVFVTGWMGFAIFQFAWYANLLMLVAVILMYSKPIHASLLAALGLLVAMQAFWFDVLPGSVSSTPITGYGHGFWFWLTGLFLLGVGVFWGTDELVLGGQKEAKASDEEAKLPELAATRGSEAKPVPPSAKLAETAARLAALKKD